MTDTSWEDRIAVPSCSVWHRAGLSAEHGGVLGQGSWDVELRTDVQG